jgi:8-oxo-dGTP diphosphatase
MSDTSELRRGMDYVGVGVGAIIVNEQGQLFLARRGPLAKNERGLWEFPGGAVEFGEQLAEALKREMREEYCVEIAVGELLDVVDHLLPAEGQHWVSPTFICTIVSGTPVIREPGKCAEIGWFAPEAAPADLTQITRENLAHYLARSLLKVPHLLRREIQASVAASLIREFAGVLGYDKAIDIAAGRSMREKYAGPVLLAVGRLVREVWAEDGAMTLEMLEETGQRLSFNVTRCRYAELYDRLGVKDLGFCLSCNRDEAFAQGFDPGLKLVRTQTIMEGAPWCDFRFYLAPEP